MMSPEVSRAAAALKNHLNLPPGDQLDRLIKAAETSKTIADLPAWVRTGLRKMNYPGA
jgi:hypothetical protein